MRIKDLTGRAGAGLLAVAAATGLVLAASPATAATTSATTAGVDTGPAVSAFRLGQHVYVYPGGDALVDSATQAAINTELAGSAVYVTVVKTPALAQVDAKSVSDALSAGTGRTGSYVLLGVGGEGTFLQLSSPLEPNVYGPQIRAAIRAHHNHPGAQALALATSLRTDKLPAKPFPWGGVVAGTAGGFVVVVLAGAYAVGRRRSKATVEPVAEVQTANL